MRYSNAQKCIRICWNENLAAEAEGIRMHEESIRMRMDAIRILEESIRMPAIQNHEQQRINAKKLETNALKLDVML